MLFSTSFNIIFFSLAYTSYSAHHILPPPLSSSHWLPLLCSLWVSSFFVIFNSLIYCLDCTISDMIQSLPFPVWLISFSLMPWIPSVLLQMAKVQCFMVGWSSTVFAYGYRHTRVHLCVHTETSVHAFYGIFGLPEGTSGKGPTCQCKRCKRWVTVQSLTQEDPLKEEMTTRFSVLT